MRVEWEGVFPAVTTKFTSDDRLDIDAFLHNINAQLSAGVNGIILGGTLGEASTLSDEEKAVLVRETVAFVEGRVPVILNIAEQTTAGAIEAAAVAERNGASGLMLLPPMRYKADARETVAYFKAVAASTDLPIMIYNNPIDYRILVTLDMFAELVECGNIQAVKESTREVGNITRMRNRFGDRFRILSGVDTLALESLVLGADGWVAGLVCAFPAETVAIYELVKAGRLEEAVKLNRWFFPLLELDVHPKLVQNIKLAEVHTGLGTEQVRLPRLPLEGEEREQVLHIIQQALETRPQLEDFQGAHQKQSVLKDEIAAE
ncbi:dihydrodipicolinate synthase family protein [Pontibacter diazotrophicus]|uniref:Dihydrodipicolinate synthase family protein n=1 Tax=Pontibacter diazotrophicus TaxID=1400979 RepID=A0A3D8L009_9BACT|nr:dihydrodipicolinate synthase family protein [Pontibacter diazotrophicus]RDV10675.1 dihydrodipicolinate synthase family protein [Pontibacter diazotrophicus]